MDQEQIEGIRRRIDAVTHAELDDPDVVAGYPPGPDSPFRQIRLIRIERIAAFWNADMTLPLLDAAQDLIGGLYGRELSWMYALTGTPSAIWCRFALWHREAGPVAVEEASKTLAAGFPGVRTLADPGPWRTDFPYAACLSGTPGNKERAGAEQIEKLCRGLYGSPWTYMVIATPREREKVLADLAAINLQMLSIERESKLLNAGASERLTESYVELLDAKKKKFELGRAVGMWRTGVWLLTDTADNLGRGQSLLRSAFSGKTSVPDPVRTLRCRPGAELSGFMPEPLNSAELAILACPPREEHPGYEVTAYTRFGVQPIAPVNSGPAVAQARRGIRIGEIFDRGGTTSNGLEIPLDDLTRHGLIAGVTGSGKTNTCFEILAQLAAYKIPFLVIESAKSEYRTLWRDSRFSDFRPAVYTVGDETAWPLRLNPFEVPPGILVQTHIDFLKTLFSAAFVLYPPMPYVLEQSIQEMYEDRGWNLAANINWRGSREESKKLFPTIDDLADKVHVVVDRLGYDDRITMDVKAGLTARLNQLRISGKGQMLNTRDSIGAAQLFERPCILELKQVVSDDEKAFFIGLLLLRLYEHHESHFHSIAERNGNLAPVPGVLRHVTLIEEAHRLLRNVSTEQGGEVSANPKGRAIEVFANLLSEIRAYGEGILIAEQVPVKLTPDAIKNTNLKVLHRLLAEDDRKVVGATIDLDAAQMKFLVRLETGQAVAYAERMQRPVLLRVPVSPVKRDHNPVPNAEIVREMQKANPRAPSCALNSVEADLLKGPFQYLFNAMRFAEADLDDLKEATGEFRRTYRRLPTSPGMTESAALGILIDREIERRGAAGFWTYSAVENLSESGRTGGAALVDWLNHAHGNGHLPAPTQAFREKLREQQQPSGPLPFYGCSECAARCQYRFDMARGREDDASRRFREALEDRDGSGLAETAISVAESQYSSKFEETVHGGALCFVVQQANLIQVPARDQMAIVLEMKTALGG